jgi:hypothetical protein
VSLGHGAWSGSGSGAASSRVAGKDLMARARNDGMQRAQWHSALYAQ